MVFPSAGRNGTVLWIAIVVLLLVLAITTVYLR